MVVQSEIGDARRAKVYGRGLSEGRTFEMSDFIVDTRDAGVCGSGPKGRGPVLWNGFLFAQIVLPFYPASFLFFLSILKLSIFRCGYHCSPGLAVSCFIIDTPTIVLSFPGSPCFILS